MLLWLEKFIFYLFIFFIPFQTRKILYQFSGSFNEWTSIYLYLTDILLLLLFFLWFWRIRQQRFLKKLKTPDFWLIVFVIISFVSLSQARNIQLGFYTWFKLLEFVGLFFYLRFNFRRVAQVLVLSGVVQSLLAIGQFISQKSLGLWFLVESPLGIDINGVAKIISGGVKMIRAYAGLPHPNVLAAFLFLCLFCLYYLWLNKKHSFKSHCFLSIVFFLMFFALFLTFSRLIIFTFLLSSLAYFIILFRKHKKQAFSLFGLFLVSCFLFLFLFWPEISSRFYISFGEQAISLRSFYIQTSFLIIKEHPFLGIGLGNFVWEIREMLNLLAAWLHQPVHNIYLLIASETGLIGLIAFLFFLFYLFRCGRLSLPHVGGSASHIMLVIAFSFLFIGLFDHFFWTLQQGQIMFWLALGLIHSLTVKTRRV